MGKRIKGIIVTPHKTDAITYKVETLYSGTMLEQLYEKLNCDLVELIYRRICGIDVEIWCDEEGKLKDDAQVVGTGLYGNGMVAEILVGTIFICATSPKGSSISLTDEQIEIISKYLDHSYELEYKMR